MNTKLNGSIIVILLMVMASIVVIIVTAIKSVTLFYYLAIERTEHVCRSKALESLALYGVALCRNLDRPHHQEFRSWPSKKGYKAIMTIIPFQNEYVVEAQIMSQSNQLYKKEYRVVREKDA